MDKNLSKQALTPVKVKVLLGVTGGIAAYKSAELVRRLKDRKFEVKVVMTESATQFITPMTMQAVSSHPVHLDLFDLQAEAAMGHIELAKWADMIVIAPATANTIAKIAHGFSDNLLLSIILASKAKLIIAPAMNQQMWANETTISNVEKLKDLGIEFLGPDSGEQACGDIGAGRMMEPIAIADNLDVLSSSSLQLNSIKLQHSELANKRIVITAGPTVEPIDPVRFISNHSSGKMGYALAAAATDMGASVTLISGPVSLAKPDGVNLKRVQTAKEMLKAVKDEMGNCDVFIGCAAVADYTPVEVATQKIKKKDEQMNIELTKNPDIISWVAAQENRPLVVGFAAESQKVKDFAKQKLNNKKLDIICANNISNSELGFNSDKNEIHILNKNGQETHLPAAEKSSIALSILEQVNQEFLVD